MRNWLRLAAICFVSLSMILPVGHQARADYVGDLEGKFLQWVDPAGNPVKTLQPGGSVVATLTITNTFSYPVTVTGMDSEAKAPKCQQDIKRNTPKLNPLNYFPLTLQPGETSKVLKDETFSMDAASKCGPVTLRWWGNITASKYTPTPTPTVTATTHQSNDANDSDSAQAPITKKDPTPFIIIACAAVITVAAGLIWLLLGRKKRGKGRYA